MKLPPQDLGAEANVLGCCLINNEVIPTVTTKLLEDDFIKPEHKKVFNIIKEKFAKDEAIDIITVNDIYDDIQFISDLASNVVTTANIKHHIGIVKSKSIRRQYIKNAEQILHNAYEGDFESLIEFQSDAMKKMDIKVDDGREKKSSKFSDIMNNVLSEMEKRYQEGDKVIAKTGIEWLDNNMKLDSELTVVAARPSTGKSTFVINVMIALAMQNKHVVMFNLEMTKEQIVEKIMSIVATVSNNKIRNSWELDDKDWVNITNKMRYLFSKNLHIYDDIFDIEEIRYKCREHYNGEGLDFVCIDYLQLMDTKRTFPNGNATITYLSRQLKLAQKEFKIPLWVLSQLSRKCEQEKRQPILADLRESGAIEQDADNVLFLHNPKNGEYEQQQKNKMELDLIIAKQRRGQRDLCGDLIYYLTTQKMMSKRPY